MHTREPLAEELSDLLSKTQPPCLSAYANVQGIDAGPRAAHLCATRLLQQAETAAVRGGIAGATVQAWLAPLGASLTPEPGQARPGRAMALLADRRGAHLWPLPFSVDEDVATSGDEFFLHPLLPVFASYRFYLLALSRKRARLFGADRYHMQETDRPGLEAEHDFDVQRENVQRHAGGEGSVFHARDHTEAIEHAQQVRFLRRVGDWLRRACTDRDRPLLLASTVDLVADFRTVTNAANLVPRLVSGSPEHCSPHELHQRALAVADPHFADERARRLRQLQEYDAQRLATDPATVLMAAARGRVQTLALARDAQLRGHFDGHSLTVDPTGRDLLDQAMVQTLRHGGDVLPVAAKDLPLGTPCLAHLRY